MVPGPRTGLRVATVCVPTSAGELSCGLGVSYHRGAVNVNTQTCPRTHLTFCRANAQARNGGCVTFKDTFHLAALMLASVGCWAQQRPLLKDPRHPPLSLARGDPAVGVTGRCSPRRRLPWCLEKTVQEGVNFTWLFPGWPWLVMAASSQSQMFTHRNATAVSL